MFLGERPSLKPGQDEARSRGRVFARICVGLAVIYFAVSVLGLLHLIATREFICATNGDGIMLCKGLGNGADQQVKAKQIKDIALQVYTASSAPAATVTVLEAVLNTEISKIVTNPADRAAFQILAATLESYLTTYIQTNPAAGVTSQTLVSITGLANAVVVATSFYGV